MSVEPGFYRHFKGKEYMVLGEARHTETGETFVLYTDMIDTWVRPVDMFNGEVLVDGKMIPRFTFLYSVDSDEEAKERKRQFSREICGNG